MNIEMQNIFSLKVRREIGSTPRLHYWGANSEYGVLKEVLLASVDNFKWLETSSVSKKSLRRNFQFDLKTAKRQHNEMVAAYQKIRIDDYSEILKIKKPKT